MRFYILERPTTDQSDAITDFSKAGLSTTREAPRCSICGRFIGSLWLMPPIRVELEAWGRRFGDVAFGGGDGFLVSERFRNEFLKAELIGLPGFEPAQIVNVASRKKIKETAPNYFLVNAARSRAAVDRQASGIDGGNLRGCDECRIGDIKRLRRLVIEPGTWSGEDVFIARGLPGTIVTSERFKNFCDHHTFSNCVLIDADRYHFDFFPWELTGASRT